mmetsp:Transcript_117065/g.294557  ORF Transcript_117065/g.294557 Transcript_117065/m.294557 type:complete len:82 (-) Transcript_117065:703-948(-)
MLRAEGGGWKIATPDEAAATDLASLVAIAAKGLELIYEAAAVEAATLCSERRPNDALRPAFRDGRDGCEYSAGAAAATPKP